MLLVAISLRCTVLLLIGLVILPTCFVTVIISYYLEHIDNIEAECSLTSSLPFPSYLFDQLAITIGITLSYVFGMLFNWRVLGLLGTSQN